MPSAATYSTSPSAVATAMRLEGFSFVGVSKSFFDADTANADTTTYDFVRINLDRQRTTNYGDAYPHHQIYTLGFRNHTATIVAQGIPTVISGCFIGSDVLDSDILGGASTPSASNLAPLTLRAHSPSPPHPDGSARTA